jgi:hypothetical protein
MEAMTNMNTMIHVVYSPYGFDGLGQKLEAAKVDNYHPNILAQELELDSLPGAAGGQYVARSATRSASTVRNFQPTPSAPSDSSGLATILYPSRWAHLSADPRGMRSWSSLACNCAPFTASRSELNALYRVPICSARHFQRDNLA